MAVLEDGQMAPDFELPKDGGDMLRLSDLRGKPVILYFYPKDDTSGCTQQAIDFTSRQAEFETLGAVIIGVSPDPVKKHDAFKVKHNLSITLLADTEKNVLESYGVWVEKSMYGRKYMGVERSTFLINADGKIIKIWRKVKVPGHVDEVFNVLKTSI